MKNGIHHIDIILENCETIKIFGKYIGHFDLGIINTKIRRTACNSIDKRLSCEKVVISLYRDADIASTATVFGHDIDIEETPFDRLRRCDITGICIYYDEDKWDTQSDQNKEEYDYILVPWGEGEWHNDYMTTKRNSFGDMYIVIEKGKTVDSYFDENVINKSSTYPWNIYGCND